MTKEVFLDRGGKIIDEQLLNDYDVIGTRRYDEATDTVIVLVERREPLPVLGCAIIIVFVLLLIAIGVWCVISLI